MVIDNWKDIYENLGAHFGKCFHYKTTRCHAERYMRALLARIERKNGWQMAEYLSDKSPHAIQNFLNRAAWDTGTVRNALTGKDKLMVILAYITEEGFHIEAPHHDFAAKHNAVI